MMRPAQEVPFTAMSDQMKRIDDTDRRVVVATIRGPSISVRTDSKNLVVLIFPSRSEISSIRRSSSETT